MDWNRFLKLSALSAVGYGAYKILTGQTFSPLAIDAGSPGASTISQNGVSLIQQQEGFSATAYPDGNGYSIGYGHQIIPGDGLSPSSKISTGQGVALLQSDLAKVVNAINTLVKVPLTQNQFDALASFTYNEGTGALQNSTLLALLNSGDYLGAAAQFSLWTIANGVHNAGLAARRAIESTLFVS